MKKRLLITSALMTAVLGASLATGTYAWYKANTDEATISKATASVSTSENTYSVGGITLTLSVVNAGTPDLVNSDGETWYYSGANLVQDAENTKFGTLTLSVSTTASANELAAYAGSYNLTLSDNADAGKILFAKTNTPYDGGSDTYAVTLTIAADGSSVTLSDTTVYYSVMANTSAPEEKVTATITLDKAS